MIPRILNLPFKQNSVFLFGPRQVGKSTLVNYLLEGEEYIEINLLKNEILLKYKAHPEQLRLEVEFQAKQKARVFVFIDEVQKCPEILNEVHWLLERYGKQVLFILTGSSARKLKKSSVNMLAGRAWQFFLFPLTHIELGDRFDLNHVLLNGSLPPVVEGRLEDAFRTLNSYVQVYLKEEILNEAIVRNIGAFSRFLNIAAEQSGQIVNYSTISRDTGVSSKTIHGYYQILEDTLLAIKLEPFLKSARKRLVMHPKFYLFDIGVINAVNGRIFFPSEAGSSIYGMLFEHFVILEVYRLIHYGEKPYRMFHWRSSHGAEVDLIIEAVDRLWAIEIKSSPIVKSGDLKGLKSFLTDYPKAIPLCVSSCNQPYLAGEIPVIPWQFLFNRDYLNIV